jgi:hypothetical protein
VRSVRGHESERVVAGFGCLLAAGAGSTRATTPGSIERRIDFADQTSRHFTTQLWPNQSAIDPPLNAASTLPLADLRRGRWAHSRRRWYSRVGKMMNWSRGPAGAELSGRPPVEHGGGAQERAPPTSTDSGILLRPSDSGVQLGVRRVGPGGSDNAVDPVSPFLVATFAVPEGHSSGRCQIHDMLG